MMTVSKFTLKVRYELCTRVASMLSDRLKPFKIRKPFAKFWERLENEDGDTINISKFNKFCDEYEMVVVDRIHSVNEDVEIDDKGENWTVYIFPKISKRARKDVFNAVVNEFLGCQSKNIHFGTSGSPLEFDEFIQNFTEDEWDELYNKMGQASDDMQKKVMYEIMDMNQMCNLLDNMGNRDTLYNKCKQIVISH
jgi:hypothetical protein